MILEIGMKHTVETLVTPENTAAKAGSGNLQGIRYSVHGSSDGKRRPDIDGGYIARG